MAEIAREPTRHPWLDRFVADPDRELADFLAGYARIAPYDRAETPDAARMLFGPLPDDDEARQALDKAVLDWLEARRLDGVPPLQGPHLDRKLREIMDAIRLVSVLFLPQTATDLRRRYVLWNSWIERLASLSGPDVRAELLSTLALTQRLVAQRGAGLNPFGLEPLWLALCEQAGGQYPRSYLSIGLLGLRLLPDRPKVPSERPWMAGLARWAAVQQPELQEFSRQWWALKALYPATNAHWRRAVADTLRQRTIPSVESDQMELVAEAMSADLLTFWQQDVGLRPDEEDKRLATENDSSRPAPQRLRSLLKRANKPLEKISPEIRSIVAGYERDAEATGDGYFLIRTCCNLGMRLLEFQDDDPVGRGQLAVELARKALSWQPTNVYAWALWRDGLEAQGDYDAAERIGWEAIRRFPENEHWRTQLALLFTELPDRQEDAESLLRETIGRFPDNAVARNQLAELLIALDRAPEAMGVVDTALAGGMANEATFDLKARLAYRFEGGATARQILEEGRNRFPDAPSLKAHLRLVNEGRDLPLVSTALRPLARAAAAPSRQADETWQAVVRGGAFRRLMDHWLLDDNAPDRKTTSLEEVRQILAEDPNFAWARYLEAELEGRSIGDAPELLGEFGIAFFDAMKRKDAVRLDALRTAHPSQAQMVDVARAFLFGDEEAADRAVAWLKGRPRAEPRPVAALRGFIERRFGAEVAEGRYQLEIASGEAFLDLIADNDNVRLDLIESALVPTDLALAA